MGLVKGVLREELGNSLRLKNRYKKLLKDKPCGSLVEKRIKGHKYYYLAFREGKKVKFIYKGKKISGHDIAEFKKAKDIRCKYKEMTRQLNKRIKYLKKALRGKENV